MVIGGNEKFRVSLVHNDAGTAALGCIGLGHSEEVALLHGHGIIDGHNGRHGVFHDTRHIGNSGYCRGALVCRRLCIGRCRLCYLVLSLGLG